MSDAAASGREVAPADDRPRLGARIWPAPRASELAALSGQVRLARLWLPIAIVGVVVVFQLGAVPAIAQRFGGPVATWTEVLFYSVLGPGATYLTLNWIVVQVARREAAQAELTKLYRELQGSHALLGAIQRVTERFAAANDLETAMRAATEGIRDVTDARGVAVLLNEVDQESAVLEEASGLDPFWRARARERDRALQRGETPPAHETRADDAPHDSWVLTERLRWGDGRGGSLHAFYDAPPDGGQRESFRILASEFGAAAEAAQARMRDVLTLIEVDRSIRAEGNLARLLGSLLERMMERAGASVGGVYLSEEGEWLRLQVARATGGATPTTATPPIRAGEGVVGTAATKRAPQIEIDLGEGSPVRHPLLAGATSAAALPLVSDDALLGVVLLGHGDRAHFSTFDLPYLQLLAGQVSLAVHNARAYLQSEELAIAEERARIAREIHDGVAQSLAFSALKLDLVGRLLDRDLDAARGELEQARSTVREMIKEVRRSIFALRPIELERYGFLGTLERYARDFGQQNDVEVDLDLAAMPELDVKTEAVLFRIFQEAMTNVAKHAGATRVAVHASATPEGDALLRIEDDGRGFDVEAISDRVTTAGGLGLRQMRERLEARGGRFEIRSEPERGTIVEAALPS